MHHNTPKNCASSLPAKLQRTCSKYKQQQQQSAQTHLAIPINEDFSILVPQRVRLLALYTGGRVNAQNAQQTSV